MTNDDYVRTTEELDRLLNDPTVPIQPALIWQLLSEIAQHERCSAAGEAVWVTAGPVTPRDVVGEWLLTLASEPPQCQVVSL